MLAIRLCGRVAVTRGVSGRGAWSRWVRHAGWGSCQCCSMGRAGRVSSWEPGSGSRGWVPASAGTTAVGAGTTDELGSGCTPALLGRATPRPWVPAFAGTTTMSVWVPRCPRGFPPRMGAESPSPHGSPQGDDRANHPHPSPLPSRERGYGSREAGGHVGPPLRRVCHPHPHSSPLPSRERGYGSREAGGHVGPPLRPGNHPHPSPLPSRERGFGSRAGLFLESRERGCGRAVRRGLCVL